MLTAKLSRIPLAHLPTPLEEMTRLRAHLGENCPRLFIKRDDQTGLATGGNKSRKLEFLMAEAQAQGADTVITTGGPQSNHCRQTAAAAAREGVNCVVVLNSDPIPREAWTGNILLDELLGAEICWASGRPPEEVMTEIADERRAAGAKPYIIPVGGSVPLGAAGYVLAVEEVAQQLAEQGVSVDRMVVTTGSYGTQAGILVGVKALGLNCIVEGMNNSPDKDKTSDARQLTQDTATFLGLDLTITAEDIVIYDACGKHTYGIITDVERQAIRLLARTEGILLDPVYTARAFGEMVNRIKAGHYRPDETLLFWHTGGLGGLFPRAAELLVN